MRLVRTVIGLVISAVVLVLSVSFFKTVSKKGESFIKLGDKWYDLHEKETLDKLGRKDKTNNCCIKALYN